MTLAVGMHLGSYQVAGALGAGPNNTAVEAIRLMTLALNWTAALSRWPFILSSYRSSLVSPVEVRP